MLIQGSGYTTIALYVSRAKCGIHLAPCENKTRWKMHPFHAEMEPRVGFTWLQAEKKQG